MGVEFMMKTLAELEKEAQEQPDAMTKPRLFLAILPSGPRNGRFLDPFMGVIEFTGIDGVVFSNQLNRSPELNMFNIPAIWVDENENS